MKSIVPAGCRLSNYSLSGSQQAALARVLYAVRQQQGLAVLCGPGGTGLSRVLDSLASEFEAGGLEVIRVNGCDLLADLERDGGKRTAAQTLPLATERTHGAWAGEVVLLVDDAHVSDAGCLADFVAAILAAVPSAGVVLAGRGRLLTLLACEQPLQEQVLLRAVLPPWSLSETAAFARMRFAAAGVAVSDQAMLTTIHEIAAGIPRAIVRLVETAILVAESHPAYVLRTADIEQMHDRLSLAVA
jgi:type II secretory pathway predicted ATPase ExeA